MRPHHRWLLPFVWLLIAAPPASAQAVDALSKAVQQAQAATVEILATAVEGATSSQTLGPRRAGSGVLIGRDGLVLTIGYLILEADKVDVRIDGRRLPARVVAYDLASGFGLVQTLAPVRSEPAALGEPGRHENGEPLLFVSGDGDTTVANLVTRRPFSGYWEYHIDGALFTAPARGDHSGAGLFNAQGELLGIGSLVVADALGTGRPRLQGNMFVPVDLLKPILAELRERGLSKASRRAWIGVNCLEREGDLEIVRVNPGSPADEAGLQAGDRLLALDGMPLTSLEAFYKALWRDAAERDVRIDVTRGGERRSVTVHTLDRNTTLRRSLGV
jgi:S1-C subfamily serine protease